MNNSTRSLGRWIPLLAGATLGTGSFGMPAPPPLPSSVVPAYAAAAVLRFQAAVGMGLSQMMTQEITFSSLSVAFPSLSYPSAGGYQGFLSQAGQDMAQYGLVAHFGIAGIGVGVVDSDVTGVSSKSSTGDFYVVGYGDATNSTYKALSGSGQFKPNANGGVTWSGTLTTPLGFPAGTLDSAYLGISGNGLIGVGFYLNGAVASPFATAFPTGAPIVLPFIPGVTSGKAITINGDGTVIVTDTPDPFSGSAFQTGSMTLNYYGATGPNPGLKSLGKFPGSVATFASGISADASKVVGSFFDASNNEHSFIFDPTTNSYIDLGAGAPVGSQFGQAYGVNSNGSAVVGYGAQGTNAYAWTAANGIQALPYLTGEATAVAECISSDSAFMGGASFDPNFGGAGIAQIWLPDGSTYNLQSLVTVLGQDTTGWQLNQVTAISPNSDGSYLFVGNGTFNGVGRSFIVELDIPAAAVIPTISSQPASQAVPAGTSAVFLVAATGASSYQWLKNGTAISGATGAVLTLASVQASDAGTYAVLITNSGGSTQSANASLTVNAPGVGASFITQPVSQTILTGSTLVFSAPASANSPPSYQWQLNGSNLAGATSSRLVLTGATAANEGTYVCVATASGVSATSNPVNFSILQTTNVGRLVNLSVNTTAGKSQVLTVGFVIGGSGTSGAESVLFRASGPALLSFGVANALIDPTLTVFSGSTAVASNDNWGTPAGNPAAVTAADTATGAFPLTNPASLDAALVASLPEAGYTAQISGNTAASGTALAEVYDTTPAASYTLANPRLINLSAKNQISVGGSMTAGFVIGGTTSKTVLVRATGPALTVLGVAGAIPDPQLALHATINGVDTILATNAGWGGDPQITAVSNAVFAFPLTNPASKDSVVLVTLAPGSYTAVASSVSGTAGIVLIEIYDVP